MHHIRTLSLSLPLTMVAGMVVGMVAGGCQAPRPAVASVDATGTYRLVSVDGKPVPATISHDGHALEVRSGSFVIGADGTCSTQTVFAPPSGKEVTRDVTAKYTQDGAALTMRWKGAGTTVGTVDGANFTMDNEGLLFVYRRSSRP